MVKFIKRAILIVKKKQLKTHQSEIKLGIALLQKNGMQVAEYCSSSKKQTNKIIKSHCEDTDLVILAGGDGTMNAAAETLYKHNITLAILPMGTANDLARTLEIPFNLHEAFQVIVKLHKKLIDIAKVNDRYFFNVAHIGLGSEVQKNLRKDDKKRWGFLSYAKTVLDVINRVRPFKARITLDTAFHKTRTLQIAIGNGRHYGGGNVIDDECEIDDGALYIVSLRKYPLWKMLLMAPLVRFGLYKLSKEIFTAKGKTIKVSTSRVKNISADGELVGKTPATFKVISGALSVVVPATQAGEE